MGDEGHALRGNEDWKTMGVIGVIWGHALANPTSKLSPLLAAQVALAKMLILF